MKCLFLYSKEKHWSAILKKTKNFFCFTCNNNSRSGFELSHEMYFLRIMHYTIIVSMTMLQHGVQFLVGAGISGFTSVQMGCVDYSASYPLGTRDCVPCITFHRFSHMRHPANKRPDWIYKQKEPPTPPLWKGMTQAHLKTKAEENTSLKNQPQLAASTW
jgi:hypothetical protein